MVIISIRIGLLISDKTRRGHYTDVATLYSGRQEDLVGWLQGEEEHQQQQQPPTIGSILSDLQRVLKFLVI